MTKESRDQFPSVDAAFSFVVPSYQIMATRFEAADSRINTLTTTALSLTTAVPVFAKAINPAVSFGSAWFVAAVACFAGSFVLGLWGRHRGRLTVVDPMAHFEKSLRDEDWMFKKESVYFAGKHMAKNAESIGFKGMVSVWMTVVMLTEVIMLAVWVATSA